MSAQKCPICDKEEAAKYAPFCSKRCSDLDLARWLNGSYLIKGRDGEADMMSELNPHHQNAED